MLPPDLNIYVLAKDRTKETIDRFVELYVDRTVSEVRDDEELMMLPLWFGKKNPTNEIRNLSLDDYDWEPAQTLTNIIERGLQFPRRSFSVYLQPKNKRLVQAILSFTADNQLILGLSVDDEGALPENERNAQQILVNLMEQFNAQTGLIIVDWSPPLTESDFIKQASNPLTLHFLTSEPRKN